ncbi:MAG: EAL domain-containing protein [Desulfohalobiaceae bacterium]|nr:EAL domain-containing protein [Desulfohalobiaceae bacterium]
MKSKSLLVFLLIGAFIGYFIFHPVFMGLGHLMHQENVYAEHTLTAVVSAAFSLQMLPWGFSFAVVFGLMGYMLQRIRLNEDLLRVANMELDAKVEERTAELKAANQELSIQTRHALLGYEIGKVLVQDIDLQSLLQLCTESIARNLDVAFARIWVMDEKENRLELMASAGMYTHIDGNRRYIPIGSLKIGMIAEEKKPHLTNEVLGDPLISDQEWVRREGMAAFAGHPLVIGDKLVGVMAMFAKQPLQDSALTALASISDEIALGIERKRSEDQIHFLAYYDRLTGLPNWHYFKKVLEKAVDFAARYQQRFALCHIDVDDFARINNTLGHKAGDECLKIVSSRLSDTLRKSDDLARMLVEDTPLARTGNDEFIVLLQAVDSAEKAAHAADRIRRELSRPYQLDGYEVFLSASIGLVLYPEDGGDVDGLLKNVETAKYSAKKNGKDNFRLYSKPMNEAALEILDLEAKLRRAIEERAFLLYYQPKVDIKTGKTVGMEALLRWKWPGGGFIPPSRFIPLAEANGLIVPIDNFVLEAACLQNKKWQESGLERLSVGVNVSGLQFGRTDYVQNVLTALGKAGLEPRCLELEVTETTIMADPERAVRNLHDLKEIGVQVSLDDFGTGYSSLNYLKELPLDSMKIDISFIRNVAADPKDAAIVKTIIAMAHNLDLKVVAEGVEKGQQLKFLKEHDCDLIQGYLFSPAVPALEFPDLAQGILQFT